MVLYSDDVAASKAHALATCGGPMAEEGGSEERTPGDRTGVPAETSKLTDRNERIAMAAVMSGVLAALAGTLLFLGIRRR